MFFCTYLHICWLLVVLIYNVIGVGHIHGEDNKESKAKMLKQTLFLLQSCWPLQLLSLNNKSTIHKYHLLQCPVMHSLKTCFCPNYEGDFVDVSDFTTMLNIHFDWIMIL